jgi:hypothetical protein
MDVVTALSQLGGEATPSQLRTVTSRQALRAALASGAVVKVRQGLVGLPLLDEGQAAARDANGAMSHLSAALHYGWAVKKPPGLPMVTVPRNRRLTLARRAGMRVFWGAVTTTSSRRG